MKMEVLLVNQFQREFGSPKLGVQDWDRSFKRPSPPPSPPPQLAVSHPRRQSGFQFSSSTNNNNQNTNSRITNGTEWSSVSPIISDENEEAVQRLAQQLHDELKESKSRHLDCTEVLLPTDLLQRIASDMLVKSEKEPCGIRGCTIFIEFQEEPNNVRRIASLKPDQDCVSTFEFYLTLNSQSSWTSKLPAFLKNLARGNTIVISSTYSINKNKLYRSFAE